MCTSRTKRSPYLLWRNKQRTMTGQIHPWFNSHANQWTATKTWWMFSMLPGILSQCQSHDGEVEPLLLHSTWHLREWMPSWIRIKIALSWETHYGCMLLISSPFVLLRRRICSWVTTISMNTQTKSYVNAVLCERHFNATGSHMALLMFVERKHLWQASEVAPLCISW